MSDAREISRREFAGLGLAAGALAAGASCRPTFITQALGRAGTGKRPTGPVEWVNSACLQCPAGCGIRVKTIAGDAIKIEGNPIHPINRGRLCPKGQAGLQVLYDPDRIQGPLKRDGERGAGAWRRISWDEAIAEVAGRLGEIRRDAGPHTVAILGGRYRGHMRGLFERFAAAFGTPNLTDSGSMGSANIPLAHYLTQGVRDYPAYDWENADYVISFGAGLIESFRPTVMIQRMVAHLRRGRPGRRGTIVTVDPRFSVTASKSDRWVPIRPGTDGALALGMAAVIVRESLHDERFIAEHTAGFDAWKSEVLQKVSLDFVSEETGIPVEEIERLAREFAGRRPSFAVAGCGAGMHANGLYNLMAIHCLNALVGSIDRPGGVLVQESPPFAEWPPVEPDEIARRGRSMPRLDGAGTARFPLAESVPPALFESPAGYRLNAALVYYTNPVFSSPNARRVREALGEIPFLVSFSPFMDDTTRLADLVLPDHTYLERLQPDVPAAGAGIPVLTLRRPVVAPLYDTRGTGDVLIQIAGALGGSVGEAFPWSNDEEAFRSVLGEGPVWEALLKDGVWSASPYRYGEPARTYRTPSGKFEFVSSLMKERLTAVASAEGMGLDELAATLEIEARGETVFMSHYERPRSGAGERLTLNTYRTMMHAEGRGGNQPWLQDSFGLQLGEAWAPWVEIHPQTARRCGVEDGERVRLESPAGTVAVRARVFEGAMPGVVSMPLEYGHVGGGRWADRRGQNPNEIAPAVFDRLSGVVSRSAAKVRILKA